MCLRHDFKYLLLCADQVDEKSYDPRMEEALELILRKKRKNHRWPVQHKHAGKVHFDMEPAGGASR
jgi:hypothetical protein